jgi:hypothetical protein
MLVRLYGFDWEKYCGHIMPALADWLMNSNETVIYQLYEQTRCAQEEHLLPQLMGQSRTWKRAQAFIKQLPKNEHTDHEYELLCSAEAFTALSDRYVHRHPPQIHQQSEALRTLWAALIEDYCLLSFTPLNSANPTASASAIEQPETTPPEAETTRDELVTLLQSANLQELAQKISIAAPAPSEQTRSTIKENDSQVLQYSSREENVYISWMSNDNTAYERIGIAIGRLPTTLHLRGWLAAHSIRAMALFELLACGRRAMPFGYQAGEQFGAFVGYLTPNELWQLAACLRDLPPPDLQEARSDHQLFLQEQPTVFRMIDEVLPADAEAFSEAVHVAAMYGWGLICSIR